MEELPAVLVEDEELPTLAEPEPFVFDVAAAGQSPVPVGTPPVDDDNDDDDDDVVFACVDVVGFHFRFRQRRL